eukprot:4256747-Amphidinium_carterae.1
MGRRLRQRVHVQTYTLHSSFLKQDVIPKGLAVGQVLDRAARMWYKKAGDANVSDREKLVEAHVLPRLSTQGLPLSVTRTN